MKVNKNLFFIILTMPIIGPLLYFLQTKYYSGDQSGYKLFYEKVANVNFLEVPILGRVWLTAIEPIHLYLMWIGSSLNIEKYLYNFF